MPATREGSHGAALGPKLEERQKQTKTALHCTRRIGTFVFQTQEEVHNRFLHCQKERRNAEIDLGLPVGEHVPPPQTPNYKACYTSLVPGIDLTEETFNSRGFGGILGEAAGNEGDVGDCFYNFAILGLASYFATKDVFTTGELKSMGILPDLL